MLSHDDVSRLHLSPEEEETIGSLGVDSVAALLAMMQAAPDTFQKHWGASRVRDLTACLEQLVTPEERAVLERPVHRYNVRGAIVEGLPRQLVEGGVDIVERDKLFNELTSLRSGQQTPDVRQRIRQLEEQLNKMLEYH